MIEEYQHPTLKFTNPEKRNHPFLSFDIYVPSLNLALEYQGKQHYEDTSFFGRSASYLGTCNHEPGTYATERDKEKVITCTREGIKIVSVSPSFQFCSL
jgi:hypothetical protein